MKKIVLLCICLSCGLWAFATGEAGPLLFPTPAHCEMLSGTVQVGPVDKWQTNGRYAVQMKKAIASEIKHYSAGQARLPLVLILLDHTLGMPDEGYTLEISPQRIALQASTETGLFYAKESLLQLIRLGKGTLPACRIQDQPRTAWRGLMLDESRHFFGKEKVFQLLDMMASLKMNVFHWHLTDEPGWRIEIKKYPRLTTVGAIGTWDDAQAPARFYTQKEIKEIVRYAAQRHIMIVPEIDMPGHAIAACKAYPEVSGGGEGRWKGFTFHPCKEETFEFLSNILEEVAGLFPSPYIHLGGDEVHYGNQSWFTDPVIQAFIREKGLKNEAGLEHYFICRMADVVRAKGKMMIGWDEIVDAGVSPEKGVVMWWRHDKPQQLQKALERGYNVVMTPRRPLYFDFVQHESHKIGRRWDGFNTIQQVCAFPDTTIQQIISGHAEQIMGLQMTLWTERIADEKRLDFMIYPRIAALAEAAWTPLEIKSPDKLMKKLPAFLEYLDSLDLFYFDPFDPGRHPEPSGPSKADVLQEG